MILWMENQSSTKFLGIESCLILIGKEAIGLLSDATRRAEQDR